MASTGFRHLRLINRPTASHNGDQCCCGKCRDTPCGAHRSGTRCCSSLHVPTDWAELPRVQNASKTGSKCSELMPYFPLPLRQGSQAPFQDPGARFSREATVPREQFKISARNCCFAYSGLTGPGTALKAAAESKPSDSQRLGDAWASRDLMNTCGMAQAGEFFQNCASCRARAAWSWLAADGGRLRSCGCASKLGSIGRPQDGLAIRRWVARRHAPQAFIGANSVV